MAYEFSARARYVTEQVTCWLANDREHAAHARALGGDLGRLRHYVTTVIREAAPVEAAWHVRRELAPNDYDRIHWDDVARELAAD